MDLDYNALRWWLDAAQALITAAIGAYLWLDRRQRVTADRIGALEADLDGRMVSLKGDLHRRGADLDRRLGHLETLMSRLPDLDRCARCDERVARVEEIQRHAPGLDDIRRLHERTDGVLDELRELSAGLAANTEAVQGLTRQVGVLLQHHLDRSD
jgi:hypothetical protein